MGTTCTWYVASLRCGRGPPFPSRLFTVLENAWGHFDTGAVEEDEAELAERFKRVWEQQYSSAEKEHYIFDPTNPYLSDPDAFEYVHVAHENHRYLTYRKGVQLFNEGHLPESIKALEAAVQQDTNNVEVRAAY